MNNCSVVNLKITGNVSLQTLKNFNSLLQNLAQSFYSVPVGNATACAWNTSAQLNYISMSYWNTSYANLSTVAWNVSMLLNNLSQKYFSRQCICMCLEYEQVLNMYHCHTGTFQILT